MADWELLDIARHQLRDLAVKGIKGVAMTVFIFFREEGRTGCRLLDRLDSFGG